MTDLDEFRRAYPKTSCQQVADELEKAVNDVTTWRRMYFGVQEENARLRLLLSPRVAPSQILDAKRLN
jgi:hypothetical protein